MAKEINLTLTVDLRVHDMISVKDILLDKFIGCHPISRQVH